VVYNMDAGKPRDRTRFLGWVMVILFEFDSPVAYWWPAIMWHYDGLFMVEYWLESFCWNNASFCNVTR
jgi:hypothetical protein